MSLDPQYGAGDLVGQPDRLMLSSEFEALADNGQAKHSQLLGDSQPEQKKADGGIRSTICDFTSSLGAGVSGVVAASVTVASLRTPFRALSIPMAMAAGGLTKYGLKTGMEHLLLKPEERTASLADVGWGAVDGLSGSMASFAERRASRFFLEVAGKKALGNNISTSTARLAGGQLVKEQLLPGMAHNVMRGMVGGSVGTAAWSLPHRTHENWNLLQTDPMSGLGQIANQTLHDTGVGTIFGGALTGVATSISRRSQIVGTTKAWLEGDKDAFRLTQFHINDFHSNLPQLPHLKTRLDQLAQQSQGKGVPSQFVTSGDLEAANPLFDQAKGGWTENTALARSGMTKAIPGNHAYDSVGGAVDVERYPAAMGKVMQEHPNLQLLAANLDVSAYPEYAAMMKPYVIDEIATPHGVQKVATIGLITDEGAVGQIKFHDPVETASRLITQLNQQGVNKVVILSHLGLGEDIKLAQALVERNLKAAAIIGGHSHDVTATPLWIGNNQPRVSWFPFLKRHSDFEIPVVQAGSHARWLGDLNLAIKPNGAADRFRTTGRMHAITPEIPPDQSLKQFIDSEIAPIMSHNDTELSTKVTSNYTAKELRNRETPLGNLISDAIYTNVKNNPDLPTPDMVLTQSGWINDQIVANVHSNGNVVPLKRLDIAKLFKNAGIPSEEQAELGIYRMTGQQIKDALEYSVRELPTPKPLSPWQKVAQIFAAQDNYVYIDEPGNFLQVRGLKYSMDLTKPGMGSQGLGQRIRNVSIVPEGGHSVQLSPEQTYTVVTRNHALEKWHSAGIFGDLPLDQLSQSLQGQKVNISAVDMVADYINGRTIDPRTVGRVEGRITNLTPIVNDSILQMGYAVPVISTPSVVPNYYESKSRSD